MPLIKFLKVKFTTSSDYLVVSALIVSGVIVMSVILGAAAYKNYTLTKAQFLQQETTKAENIISKAIEEHSWQIRSLADKIMKAGDNLKKINDIITSHNKFDTKSNFDQFLNQKDIYWVDKNDDVVVKNKIGILRFPQKISGDYEVFNSKKNSWKLLIAKDLPHQKDGYNLILTSFGVTDNSGNYLGSIVSSIEVSFIENLLIQALSKESSSLVVLSSNDNKIVFQSSLTNFIADSKFFSYKLPLLKHEDASAGMFNGGVLEGKINYTNYKKIANYPLIILSGYDHSIYNLQLLKLLIKTIYPNVLVGLILLVALFLFYKRIVKPIKKLSEIARKIGSDNSFDDKFPKDINSPEIFDLTKALLRVKRHRIKLEKANAELVSTKLQLEKAIEVIKKSDLAQIDIFKQIRSELSKNTSHAFHIVNMLKHNLESYPTSEGKLNLLLVKSLEQEITNITEFATDELNKDEVNIQNLMNKVTLSQAKKLSIKNITLKTIYDKNLPQKVLVDQVRLIQVLSGILSKTIGLLSENDQVTIEAKLITKSKKKMLSIRFQDNGIGIGFKEYNLDAERFGAEGERAISGLDISTDTIEELIRLHQGQIFYENKIQEGATTTVLIPCIRKINRRHQKGQKNSDNIIYLPLQKKDS